MTVIIGFKPKGNMLLDREPFLTKKMTAKELEKRWEDLLVEVKRTVTEYRLKNLILL